MSIEPVPFDVCFKPIFFSGIYLLPDQVDGQYKNSFSIGFDIETEGHVFQLHLTNSPSMIERGYVTETVGDWANGDIHFEFNVPRVFTIKSERHQD